jgi:hypothetical protein
VKIYQNLFAYLNGDSLEVENTVLQGCDRPILIIDSDVKNSVLIQHSQNIYEIGFPYLKPTDLEQHDDRCQTELKIEIDDLEYLLFVTDEVIDAEAIEDETQLKEWLGTPKEKQLNTSIGVLLQNFNGLFNNKNLWRLLQKDNAGINLHYLPRYLSRFDVNEASLPLVVSLENQYELSRKLRTITPRLRHQLRRKAELISISRIQEMDSYCLRDYIRRPGRSPEEKAGAKQQLMGVKREQNYNTVENKFLIYFAGRLLHLECFRYEQNKVKAHLESVKKLRQTIDVFNQSPLIKNISVRHFRLSKPNYVLLQNPIYNSFYRAYQDYIYRRSQKQRLWSYRNNLLGDTVYLCLTATLLQFQGVNLNPLSNLKVRTSPEEGNYIDSDNCSVSIPVFLQDLVYDFKLSKNSDLTKGDYSLTIELHDLKSSDLTIKTETFPIWIFWYKPSEEIINSANNYIAKSFHDYSLGILLYLEESPNVAKSFAEDIRREEARLEAELEEEIITESNKNIWSKQIDNPLRSGNFHTLAKLLAREIIKPLAEMVQ